MGYVAYGIVRIMWIQWKHNNNIYTSLLLDSVFPFDGFSYVRIEDSGKEIATKLTRMERKRKVV